MARNGINQRAIEKQMRELVRGYEKAARKHPIRVPVRTERSAEGVSVAGRPGTEHHPVLSRLLLWLDEQARRNPSLYVDVTRFVDEFCLYGEDPAVLAFELAQDDLVKVARSFGGSPDVHLTDAGRAAIHRLAKLRQDRSTRLRCTMDTFLRWLFDTAGTQESVNPGLFLRTTEAYFAGVGISAEELYEALVHLMDLDLVVCPTTEPDVVITAEGARCALAGGKVQDYVNQPRSGATYNNYMPNAKGVIMGDQKNFTQNNTDGVDPTLFAQFAGYVGQVSSTLGMSEVDRVELERVAQDLHGEATSASPAPGRLRQLASQLRDTLLQAGTTIAATMGVQMAEQALATL
ncbi:hypothetical protein [Streptomyces erythrochromogenes]|uniref:hypothetical protein n=1 Tax=Streptomyces erythrochromogenes TaxID=285574 RepID=UPI0038077ACF